MIVRHSCLPGLLYVPGKTSEFPESIQEINFSLDDWITRINNDWTNGNVRLKGKSLLFGILTEGLIWLAQIEGNTTQAVSRAEFLLFWISGLDNRVTYSITVSFTLSVKEAVEEVFFFFLYRVFLHDH
ncbi:hypothetical protein NPIL_385201 [Nephila pilipes]|uniref:Uncharacterized protein n=1 Tax=Nephila pilipes TaxID=299642 RepID=A0A8X6QEQ1_NEPPI|nr:hypothetical protein NPIL_385201 [Nephila pilipes]